MKTLTFSLLLALPLFAQPEQIVTLASGSRCVRLAWITPTPGTTTIKVYADGGALIYTVDRLDVSDAPVTPDRTHVGMACGLEPSTAYDVEACSDEGMGEDCSAKQDVTTAAEGTTTPTLPTPVDVAWTAGAGDTLTVGADCRDGTTGLQARLTAAAAANNGDKIVIPTTTKNCGMVTLPAVGAGTDGILITTDATDRPPAGVRDSTAFAHSTIYRNWVNMSFAADLPRSGNVDIQFIGPGSLFYDTGATWTLQKAALAGSPVAVTNATNATPIVITAPGHGKSNGETVCLDSVLGNLAANGCFKVANVSGDSFQLTLRDGTNQAGSGAYTSGGQVQGLVYTTVARTDIASPAGDACVTPGAWARDTDVANYYQGMYRCTDQLVWLKVENSLTFPQPTDFAQVFSGAINADVGAHHYRIEGIEFADPGWGPEPEYSYAPQQFSLSYGTKVGGVFVGAHGSHHIDFNQNIAMSDIGEWRTEFMFSGFTSDFIWRNSSLSCGAYYPNAYVSETEMQCYGLSMPASIGPLGYTNNYTKVGGFALLEEGSGGYTINGDITFDGNYIDGALDFQHGTTYYDQAARATGPIGIKTRQLFELKTGKRVSVRGNYFDGTAFSTTVAPSAITAGTQTTTIGGVAITDAGVATASIVEPYPLSVEVGDKFLSYNNTPLQTAILTVASKTATTVTFTLFDGSAYDLSTQTAGFLCNLNGAPISDLTIEGNQFVHVPIPMMLFGDVFGFYPSISYGMCQLGPLARVSIKNNHANLINIYPTGSVVVSPPGTATQSAFWTRGFVTDILNTRNTAVCDALDTSDFTRAMMSDTSTTDMRGGGLGVYANILCAQDYGVSGDGTTGTTLLDARWPQGYTWVQNAYVRSGGSIAGEPAGNAYPTSAQVDFNAAGYPAFTSSYRSYGASQSIVDDALGALTNISYGATDSSVTVRFRSPVAGQHWYVQWSLDGTTWDIDDTATSTGVSFDQTATFAAASGTVYYVRVLGASTVVSLTIRTP